MTLADLINDTGRVLVGVDRVEIQRLSEQVAQMSMEARADLERRVRADMERASKRFDNLFQQAALGELGDLRCAECHTSMTYIRETYPDNSTSLRAWCVNGERGCKSAGKMVVIEKSER